jgi:hypothetical protein
MMHGQKNIKFRWYIVLYVCIHDPDYINNCELVPKDVRNHMSYLPHQCRLTIFNSCDLEF